MDSFKLLRNGPIGANGEVIAPTALQSASVAFLCRVPARGQQIGRALVQAALLFQRPQCSRRNFRRKNPTATQIFLSTTAWSTAGLLARNPLRTGHPGREKCCLVQKNGQKKSTMLLVPRMLSHLTMRPSIQGQDPHSWIKGAVAKVHSKATRDMPPLGVGNSGRSLRFTRRLVLLCQK